MATKKLALNSDQEALLLLGERDVNLRRLEKDFGVEIFVRHDTEGEGMHLSLRGPTGRVDKALRKLREMLGRVRSGGTPEVQPAVKTPAGFDEFSAPPVPKDAVLLSSFGKAIRPRTAKQQEYVDAILAGDMTFGIGPAGTGKTYLAVACALRALRAREVSRIVLTRPVVEAGEKLGFLPGDLYEKVHPYLKPLYDAFYHMLGPDKFRMWREDDVVEIVPLAYMRGRTLEEAFIILDEAQNTTPEQMKMFLTRMGEGSKAVITGDVTQIDLPNKAYSGLVTAKDILHGVEGIQFVQFGEADVVRHALVKKILRAYDKWEKK
ncbi:MAG: PhoH family protein [Elusimicrobia bacterium]|nr:PhoH family protein [Elusimicrobiota bacterium]